MKNEIEHTIQLSQEELTDLIDLLYDGIQYRITQNYVPRNDTDLLFGFTDIVRGTAHFHRVIKKEMEEQELNNPGECDFGMMK